MENLPAGVFFVVRNNLAACLQVDTSVLGFVPPTTRDSTFAYLDGHRLSFQILSVCLALYKNPARPVPLHHPSPLTYNQTVTVYSTLPHVLYFPVFAEGHVTG